MMAPAITGSPNPSVRPIPSNATPTVATVDHELPVASEISAEMTTVAGRKYSGRSTYSP